MDTPSSCTATCSRSVRPTPRFGPRAQRTSAPGPQLWSHVPTRTQASHFSALGGNRMKIVVFGDERRVGALQDGFVVDLNRASERLPSQLEAFIAGGQSVLDEAQRAIERGSAGALAPIGNVKLHAPWPMRRIACVGGNYAAHLAGMEGGRSGEGEVTLESITQKTGAARQW